MDNQNKFTRRRFVALSVMGVGGMCILSHCTNHSISKWRFFTDQEAILMDALAEQIIPTDEWPGGRDAGVTNFIDIQLVGTYSRYQEIYRKGLMGIQETCKSKFNKRFEELPLEEQTLFLKTMETGRTEGKIWANGFDSKFFNLIIDHSLQGFYGSPRHGGNKNYVSYKMIKLDYPEIIGQNRYKSAL
jgi:gluconate 2-dehydrogenase gamma chain